MAATKTFKELDAWKKAIELTKVIYLLSSKVSFNSDFPLRDQIRRAAISVPSYIAEGFEREVPISRFHVPNLTSNFKHQTTLDVITCSP